MGHHRSWRTSRAGHSRTMPFEFGRELNRYPQDHTRCCRSVMMAHVWDSNLGPHFSVFQINTALENPLLSIRTLHIEITSNCTEYSWATKIVKLLKGCRQVPAYLLDRAVLSRGDIKLCEMEVCTYKSARARRVIEYDP